VYFLSWIIIGLITGWLTGKLLREGGYGPAVNIVMGIAGAVVGGCVALLAGSPNYLGLVYTIFAAILGAAIVTGINACATGRRRYA
jgi:uncharacterized membrane protein YeaQ/YmgE (transglycosylase-associated protein family)